jgi:peptide/nickel transport system substrate-binding protein
VPAAIQPKQAWFRDPVFRRAVSLACDRESLRKIAYAGRAEPIWQPVTPGNRLWFDRDLKRPPHSTDAAKRLLAAAGYQWDNAGQLLAPNRAAVTFTLAVNGASAQHQAIATLLEQDLQRIGVRIRIVPLEFRSLIDRVMNSKDYEAAIHALASGDADPGPENLNPTRLEPWESEIDSLMRSQMTTANREERFDKYRKVQALAQEAMPITCLVSPHILTIAKPGLRNLRQSILPPYALANIDELDWERRP